MDNIANVASIITIILFIIYIVGRIIAILKEKNLIYEKIEIFYKNSKESLKKYKIVDEFELDKESDEYLIITPNDKSFDYISIYEYSDYLSGKKRRIYKRDKVLNKGYSIKINVIIAESMPRYLIKFQRSDYMNGEMEVVYNGKNGVQEEMIKCNHTLKSILYYFFK